MTGTFREGRSLLKKTTSIVFTITDAEIKQALKECLADGPAPWVFSDRKSVV